MDARGVQRLLEKVYALADTATTVGAKSAAGLLRDARLSGGLKEKLTPLYQEESLRRALLHSSLGLALCRAIEPELDDAAAHAQMEFFRVRLQALYENARADLTRDFAESKALDVVESSPAIR